MMNSENIIGNERRDRQGHREHDSIIEKASPPQFFLFHMPNQTLKRGLRILPLLDLYELACVTVMCLDRKKRQMLSQEARPQLQLSKKKEEPNNTLQQRSHQNGNFLPQISL